MATDATLVKQIADLKKLKVGGLREKYKEVFGEETKSSNRSTCSSGSPTGSRSASTAA